jgi:DNA-directed RNA polymerase beta' subunit
VSAVNVDYNANNVRIEFDPARLESLSVSEKEIEGAFPTKYEKESDLVYTVSLEEEKTGNPEVLTQTIGQAKIRGIPEIKRVLTLQESGEWIIRTDGSNLEEVIKIDGVNAKQTSTNNIHEIAEIFGIEAARNALIKEAHNVLEEQGLDVDIRHVMLVADIMTKMGEVQQIGRHGISGEKSSVQPGRPSS